MSRMKLTILPSPRQCEDDSLQVMERDGFVDEQAVLELLAGPIPSRSVADSRDLILSVDDMDFAGWRLSPTLPARSIEPVSVVSKTKPIDRRPAPPVLDEPGLGAPHRGSHRWWLAGLAGALSTMLFSLLLLSLSNRGQFDAEGFSIIRTPEKTELAPDPNRDKNLADPELTDISPVR
jgi:hypothetical protein